MLISFFEKRFVFAKVIFIICIIILTASTIIFLTPDIKTHEINNDDVLDIFTSSHNSPQSLLISNSSGNYRNELTQWGLDQDKEFPGLEESNKEPTIDQQGVYIYRQAHEGMNTLNIRSSQVSISGKIQLYSTITIKKSDLAKVKIEEKKFSSGAIQTTVQFTLEENGFLSFESYHTSLSHSFILDQKFPLSQVFVGFNKVSPNSHDFILNWRDRHGMAWADYDGDQQIDVFIARGGLQGKMQELLDLEVFRDELFVHKESKFEDNIEDSNMIKKGCAAYHTAWVDFNNDNQLDLYNACPRGLPNQLYQQKTNGEFIDVASQLGLDIKENSFHTPFVWLDADNDGDMDLLIEQNQSLWFYRNSNDKFQPQMITSGIPNVRKFTIADYDLDGDIDVFALSKVKSSLLVNNNGKYIAHDPQKIGLPMLGHTANWIDYDNDGLPDLHVIPDGLYHHNSDHTFTKTGLLEYRYPSSLADARCAWFDINNDGYRDVLIAVQYHQPFWKKTFQSIWHSNIPEWKLENKEWNVTKYETVQTKNHWLQIDLVGKPGNAQAIGGKVVIVTSDTQQMQSVGSAESSHYSQGHYRIYFGLGKHKKIDSIQVIWPNGEKQEIQNVATDQRLTIEQKTLKS